MAPPSSINKEILAEVIGARADICVLDEKVATVDKKVDTLTSIVQEHERVLYKGNGKEGIIARLNDLEEKADLREKRREDDRKLQKGFMYSLIGAIILTVLDIFLHYINVF